MRSCIRLSYIAVFWLLSGAVPPAAAAEPRVRVASTCSLNAGRDHQDPATSPDALYADRENPAAAARAVAMWEARVAASPEDVDSAWKLARAHYWMGTNGPGTRDEKKRALEDGMAAARHVIDRAPGRPEGHFWLAANMGALAEAHGLRQGLRYRGAIKTALETVLRLDPAYLDGSADRALGRWYFKVPGLFGGNKRRSEEHLRKALAYNPDSVITRVFLAETLLDLNRKDEARRELEAALAAPLDPEWAPEDRVFKQQARRLLSELSR
jgi:tetratricopeptide (TPR) repeat protein